MTMADSSHAPAPSFDTGPLSWVIGEIREALARSGSALQEAAGQGGDARDSALQRAQTHLHQAHGALQMVDVDGVGLMTQLAEDALARFRTGVLDGSDGNTKIVLDVFQAVVEYLDELL